MALGANTVYFSSDLGLVFEGPAADTNELYLIAQESAGGDKVVTIPSDKTGEIPVINNPGSLADHQMLVYTDTQQWEATNVAGALSMTLSGNQAVFVNTAYTDDTIQAEDFSDVTLTIKQ